MLGPRLSYLNADGDFRLGSGAPVSFLERSVADSGLALEAVWDTRDNTMTPDRGQLIELVAWRYDEALAGDYNYWKGEFKALSFTRWAVVAFAGGVGGRYLFRPQDNLWVGVDIAKGPEDAYAYIQVGHAW